MEKKKQIFTKQKVSNVKKMCVCKRRQVSGVYKNDCHANSFVKETIRGKTSLRVNDTCYCFI